MKKIVLLTCLICMVVSVSFAAKVAYEPETPDSASFSATDEYSPFIFISFVNYANKNGSNEYWVRMTIMQDYSKILYNAALNIDGTNYDLQPVYNPDYKYIYAATSNIPNHVQNNIHGVQPFRYYVIPQNVINRIISAKKITFVYNRADRLNLQVPLYDNYLAKIKDVFALKYTDLGAYYHPESN